MTHKFFNKLHDQDTKPRFADGLLALSLPNKTLNTYHQHIQHHVIVVDEEDELLPAMRELRGHLEHKVLHLGLKLTQDTTHTLTGKCLVHAHNGC